MVGDLGSAVPRRLARGGLLAGAAVALICEAAQAEEAAGSEVPEAEDRIERNVASGLLPQLGVALRLPEGMQLYDPDGPQPPDGPVAYRRLFPIGAERLINEGYALPLPIGLTVIGVDNTQGQDITDLSVALGKGVVPPEDTPLVSIPFVNVDSISMTQSGQVKLDLWVLPFLNVFATAGRITGEADIDVSINLDDLGTICIENPLPSGDPICIGNDLTGSISLPFTSQIDRTSATLGLTGAYSVGRWFGSLTLSRTETYGEKSSDIESTNGGFRFGRRFTFGKQHVLSPYAGVNYLDIDTRISGFATLKNAFPDGDDLSVRYDAKLDNQDKWSGVLGLNIGFNNGTAVQAEWNKSSRSERFVLSTQIRF